MPVPLTDIERKIYHYLLDFLTENTYQPSVRDIGAKFQIRSTKTVSELLQSLANKGYIERDPSRSRGVRLLGYEGTSRTRPVPYYLRLGAGEPALLAENRAGFITMDRRFVPSETTFILKASSNSMAGRGILDGDYLMVNPGATPRDGDMVVVRVDEAATVKTVSHHGDRVVLGSADAAGEEVTIKDGADSGLLGVVCGVFRPFQESEPSGGNTRLDSEATALSN
jgi:SOS regulatory protein LexA